MPEKQVVCRHCGEAFVPLPGKPGYIDECPDCLYDKTVPFEPKGLARRTAEQNKRFEKAIAELRLNLAKHAVSQEAAERIVANLIEMAENPPATH